MQKLSIGLFIAHLSITIILTSLGKYSFGVADAIVSVALLAFSGYLMFLSKQEIPDVRAEVAEALQQRDDEIRKIKNDMAQFNIVKTAVNDSVGFRF